jgi:hypothetical protein
LPSLKERADFVTSGEDGAGVEELIEKLLSNDLSDVTPRPKGPQAFSDPSAAPG